MNQFHLITLEGHPTEAIDCSPAAYLLHLWQQEQAFVNQYPQKAIKLPSIVYSAPISEDDYHKLVAGKVVRLEAFDNESPT